MSVLDHSHYFCSSEDSELVSAGWSKWGLNVGTTPYPLKYSPFTSTHFLHLMGNLDSSSSNRWAGIALSSLRMAALTAGRFLYFTPLKCSFRYGKRKKSQGAKSGLYGGCANMSWSNKYAKVRVAVWGLALSCWIINSLVCVSTPPVHIPGLFLLIHSLSLHNVGFSINGFLCEFYQKASQCFDRMLCTHW